LVIRDFFADAVTMATFGYHFFTGLVLLLSKYI